MTINYQQPWGQFPTNVPSGFMTGVPTGMPGPFPTSMPFGGQMGVPFPGITPPFFPQQPPQAPGVGSQFFEQSFIENILRLNRGKTAVVYMSFEGSQWGSKIFKGEILEAGRDHIILKDNQTNITYLLLMIYLSYVTFEGDIEYEYPFGAE